ncbi:MAG: arginine deiminase family protein [Thermoanaerobaculia bacterium]|nr:arginine deiminase family protein [Thermoanaerobaculia bacterium]
MIRVDSEIGRLRRVLVHRPGFEIDWMVPRMMEELLFDDILYGQAARREHGRFRRVLESAGVEVLEVEDLLAEVLEIEAVRAEIVAEVVAVLEPGVDVGRLETLSSRELAGVLVRGIRRDEVEPGGRIFELDPVPNYFFQRDPQMVIGDRVVIASMATRARFREPRLARLVFAHHPDLTGAAALYEINPGGADLSAAGPGLEGGDVLVASEDTLLVGISHRTNRRGVEILADYLRREETPFRHLVLVDLPSLRSYMHLDTVFTLVDVQAALAFLPLIDPSSPEAAGAYYVDLRADDLRFALRRNLVEALERLGWSIELIPCGGAADLLDQEREQWTDGANSFAVAPGVVLLYERNRRTIDELDSRGWRVITEGDVLDGTDVLGHGRTVITVPGHELSRARGGPHCMTMPLEREPVGESRG